MISGQIYRVVTYKQSSRYKYSVQLEKQAKEKKKTKKKSKKTGKEKANDVPDWAKRQSYNPRKSAEQNATDVLNKKYGKGNWKKGPGSDFSKIKKWLQRSKGYK